MGVNWITSAQNEVQYWAVVNTEWTFSCLKMLVVS